MTQHKRSSSIASMMTGTGKGAFVRRVILTFLLAFGLVAQPLAATAAGTAVLTVSATPVHYLDGSAVTTAGQGINGSRVSYRVSFSCSVANCTGATVKVDPTQLDPNYNFYRLLSYSSWQAPTTGGTISGTAAAGYTVNLGNLGVGASDTFTLHYIWGATGSYTVNERSDVAASNFPNDYPLTIGLTADATTAVAPYSTTSAAALWKTTIPDPGIVTTAAASVLTDTDYTYQLRFGSGCTIYYESAAKGSANYLCASDYTVSHTLPAGAVLVSVTGDSDTSLRSYNPVTNTITWEAPEWSASGKTAAVGWNTHQNWTGVKPRYITVRFPAADFAPSGSTCDFTTPVTLESSASVTYISAPGVPGVVKPATDIKPINVYCVTPFGKAVINNKFSTFDGYSRESASISVVTIPTAPLVNEKYWEQSAANMANIEGTAVTTDNSLDLAGAPVHSITAFKNSTAAPTYVPDADATIEWEATNGTTTQTGTASGSIDIVELLGAGWRLTKSTVTSSPLAGPNPTALGTARTHSIVQYGYRVSPTAPSGVLRTNTASVLMTYPGTTVATIDLGSRSHSIRFNAPFAKAVLDAKDSSNDGLSGATRLVNVPATGTNAKYWGVQVSNQANVPGVAVITDNQLGLTDAPVYAVSSSIPAGTVISYELDNGATGTSTLATYTAPTGRSIVKATVTSGSLAAANGLVTQTQKTTFLAYFYYRVGTTAPVGEYRTNTAAATMSYPGNPQLGTIDLGTASATIRFATAKANFIPQFTTTAVIAGGGSTATPATDVTFNLRGGTNTVYSTVDITPQYVFAAPAGWEITPGSASFPAGSVPAGVTFSYRTVTIAGVSRQIVSATWPSTVAFGKNDWWPVMSVVARPASTVVAGTTSVATAYITDSRHTYSNTEANYTSAVLDAPDLDGDGATTEYFASITQNVLVGAAGAMRVIKEICSPTSAAADGCTWISDSSSSVGVAPNSTSIKYRLTVRNTGNTTLSNVVGYDVLPFIGDTGTSDATASTPRNSDFAETVNAVSNLTSGVTATYSTSSNPPRPEVYSGSTTGTWTSTAAGARSIRMVFPGNVTPGNSVSMVYTANVIGSPTDGAKACNTFAVKLTGIGTVSEPAAVCAAIQEADLELTVANRLPLQVGRPGIVPFVVENNGGAATANARIEFTIPTGITVRNLQPAGWICAATPAGVLVGPVTLACEPVNGSGLPRTLAKDAPETINLAVTPTVTSGSVCIGGTVIGVAYDGTAGNNSASACTTAVSATNALVVTKDDSRTSVAIGDTYTYTITASNGLVSEPLGSVVVTDTLPAGVEFVSATNGGTHSGGVVTWPAQSLTAAGTSSSSGGTASGNSGSTYTTTVTVKVLTSATGSITNVARASAPDPLDNTVNLTGSFSDSDTLHKLAISKSSTAPTAGVLSGDEVTYTVTLSNVGTAAYTAGSPAVIRDILGGVLDDATFVAGSGSVSINGGTAQPVVPAAGVIGWSGVLPAGQTVVLIYRVLVGDGASGDRELRNTAYSTLAGTACAVGTGLDSDGYACAQTVTRFAPSFSKTIQSTEQLANGAWRIVYALDIVNLNDDAAVTYSLGDTLAFGSGIVADTAAVTASPAGTTPVAWFGTGAVVTGASIPAGASHHYELTVVTETFVPSTSAACVTNSVGGFGNTATFTPVGGVSTAKWVCAQPVAPTISKTVASPTQLGDGSWNVVYTVTATASAGAPSTGLAYTISDLLGFPAGVTTNSVGVTGPVGAAINPSFTGAAESSLLTTPDRVTIGTPRVFTITVNTSVPAGAVTGADLACAPAGSGGYANTARIFAGSSSTQLGQAAACTAVTAEPTPSITKSVASTVIDSVSGEWTIGYEITVSNPSATIATSYNLGDRLQFGDGISISTASISSGDATTNPAWNGVSVTNVVTDVDLAGGAVHTYDVSVTADTVLITDANVSDMDCQLSSGETGTGFRNVATLATGVVTPNPFAVACTPANDPSVVKTVAGAPVQDVATGIWTIEYELAVTNRATTGPASYPYTLADSFDFPAGTTVGEVTVTGPAGVTLESDFDGQGNTLIANASIAQATGPTTPTTQLYTVTVEFTPAAGLDAAEQYCAPDQSAGGMRNEVELSIGARSTSDVACADVPDVPIAGVSKSVLSQTQNADGIWEVLYRISVGNPDPAVTTVYDLNDEFTLGAGINLAETPTIVARPSGVVVETGWNGGTATSVAEQIALPGGGTHEYTVRALVDSHAVTADSGAGDCAISPSETGTGFGNLATVVSGGTDRDAAACVTAYDPAVTKTVDGAPVLQSDGSWIVSYVITVLNPTADVDLTYELTDQLDFPAGTVVSAQTATGRTGSPVASGTWNGVDDLGVLPAGTALAGGATHVFDVIVRATLPSGQSSQPGGWSNGATVASSTNGDVTTSDIAAADIALPELTVTKSSDAPAVVELGDVVTYTVRFENTGESNYTADFPAEVWDDLSGVLDDATLAGAVTVEPSVGTVTPIGDRMRWSGPLAVGDVVELTYSVTVTSEGDHTLENIAFAPLLPGTTPTTPVVVDCDDDACAATSTALPTFAITKTASAGVLSPGAVVEYTVTYTNTSDVDVSGGAFATFTDDLSYVLDDATPEGAIDASTGSASIAGNTLTWTGTLAGGASATVSYSVRVNKPLTGDQSLSNTASVDPRFATGWEDGTCPDDEATCDEPERDVTVVSSVRSLAFTKTADSAVAGFGQVITYTITVQNTGAADFTSADPAVIRDSMTGVLDDAKYNNDATASTGTVSFASPVLTWTGELAAGASETITYSVKVNGGVTGDRQLVNLVGIGGGTPASAVACAVDATDNGDEFCSVSTAITRLATTGVSGIELSLVIAFALLGGGFLFLLVSRRRKREPLHRA